MIEPLSQFELFEPEHVSFHMDRLRFGFPERIYLRRWQELNVRHPAVNSGFTYLEHILTPRGRTPGPVSRRDAMVAAAVIQWLGTNCGCGFLMECEREIEAHHKLHYAHEDQVSGKWYELRWHRSDPVTRKITFED